MTDYTQILIAFYSDQQWTINGNEYSGLIWLSDTPKPTKKELDALWPKLQEKLEADKAAAEAKKQAILDRLGITAEEAKIILS